MTLLKGGAKRRRKCISIFIAFIHACLFHIYFLIFYEENIRGYQQSSFVYIGDSDTWIFFVLMMTITHSLCSLVHSVNISVKRVKMKPEDEKSKNLDNSLSATYRDSAGGRKHCYSIVPIHRQEEEKIEYRDMASLYYYYTGLYCIVYVWLRLEQERR